MIKDLLEGKKARTLIEGDENVVNPSESDKEEQTKELTIQGLKDDLNFEIKSIEHEIGKLERYLDFTGSIRQRLDKIETILYELKELGVEEMSAGEYLTRR